MTAQEINELHVKMKQIGKALKQNLDNDKRSVDEREKLTNRLLDTMRDAGILPRDPVLLRYQFDKEISCI